MKNSKKLTRKELVFISGGDTPFAICDVDGKCPPGFPGGGNSYCSDGICYRVNPGGGGPGGGGPGGGCIQPQHLCQSWETGCGCVYI